MRDYVNTFVSEYGDVLTTHLETVVVAPPSSPSDAQSVVDGVVTRGLVFCEACDAMCWFFWDALICCNNFAR